MRRQTNLQVVINCLFACISDCSVYAKHLVARAYLVLLLLLLGAYRRFLLGSLITPFTVVFGTLEEAGSAAIMCLCAFVTYYALCM